LLALTAFPSLGGGLMILAGGLPRKGPDER
jgi:hypothetical protein